MRRRPKGFKKVDKKTFKTEMEDNKEIKKVKELEKKAIEWKEIKNEKKDKITRW